MAVVEPVADGDVDRSPKIPALRNDGLARGFRARSDRRGIFAKHTFQYPFCSYAVASTSAAAWIAPNATCSAVMPPCRYTSYGARNGASHERSIVAPLTNEPADIITGWA